MVDERKVIKAGDSEYLPMLKNLINVMETCNELGSHCELAGIALGHEEQYDNLVFVNPNYDKEIKEEYE